MLNLLAEYAAQRGLRSSTIDQMRWTIASLSRHLKRPATCHDLCRDVLNHWLSALIEAGRAMETVASRRRHLRTLWRFAWRSRRCSDRPKRLRPVKVPRRAIHAWSDEDARRVLTAAATLPGVFRQSRVSRAAFFTGLIRVGIETGLRPGDLLALRWCEIDGVGRVRVFQGKTSDEVVASVSAETLGVLQTLHGRSAFVFKGAIAKKQLRAWLRKITTAAGVSGSLKMTRRTGATLMAIQHPGQVAAFLGHRTPGLAERYYVDRSQVCGRVRPSW